MNCCSQMVRTWEETQDGKYPASEHSPACDQYTLNAYAVVEEEDRSVVIEVSQVSDWMAALIQDYQMYPTVSVIQLTEDQFHNMQELDG